MLILRKVRTGVSTATARCVAAISGERRDGGLIAAIEQIVFAPIGNQNQGEDSLSINVQVPNRIDDPDGLPILFRFHGEFQHIAMSFQIAQLTSYKRRF